MATCEKCIGKSSKSYYETRLGDIVCLGCGKILDLPRSRQVPSMQDDGDFIPKSIQQNDPGHAKLRHIKRDGAVAIAVALVCVIILAFFTA